MTSRVTKAFLWLGLFALVSLGSLRAAPTLEELQQYVKRNPNNIRAVYYLGKMHAQNGNHGQAIRLFMYLFKKPAAAPGSPNVISEKLRMDLLNRIGLSYFKSNDDARAEKIWTYALKRYPTDEFARKGLAAIQKRRSGPVAVTDKPNDANTTSGGGTKPADTTPPPPAEPKVSAAEASKAFTEGKASFDEGQKLVAKGDDNGALGYFAQAREKLEIALKGDHNVSETRYLLGMSILNGAAPDDIGELETARDHLEAAYKMVPNDPKITPDITFGLAKAYGLLDDNDNEIKYYERTLELRPNFAEAHFRTSLAYDKAKRPDWSAKSFEHAKKAIKLDPNFKKKFQPMIRNSQVAKKVAGIIHEIIQKSEDSQIPDEEAARYAEEIGKVLGDNNIKSEMLGEEAGNSQEALKEMIKDPTKRQKLRQYWDTTSGGDPAKVADMYDKASENEKAAVDKFLSNDKNKSKIQKYLGNKLGEVNQQQE